MAKIDYSSFGSPWLRLDLSLWAPLLEKYSPTLYPENKHLYYQGDEPEFIYIIKSGRVRVTSYQVDGGEQQLYIAENGAITGEMSCLTEEPHLTSAFSIVKSDIYVIPAWDFKREMADNWDFTQQIIQVLCRKNNIYREQLLNFSFRQAHQRIASTILYLCQQYGSIKENQAYISIRFTNQDIATLVGVTRVTVNNVLTLFTKEKLIERTGGYYKALNIERLIAIKEGEVNLSSKSI